MLFCVCFRRATKIRLLLRLRLIPTNRWDFACILGALAFSQVSSSLAHGLVASLPRLFAHALLNIQKVGGAQAFPLLANNSAGLFAAYQPLSSRQRYWLAAYTQPL